MSKANIRVFTLLFMLVIAVQCMSLTVPVVHGVRGARITVAVGTTVRAYAHVNNPHQQAVSIAIGMEIKRDIISGDDTVKVKFGDLTVSVPSGDSFVDMGTFVADEKTYDSGSGRLRQYFMKVWINGQLVWDPTSDNGYGPDKRECVTTT